MTGPPRGLVIAAPASGSGKTVVAMGLIAAWRRAGSAVAAAKSGPDYIDTAFLSAAAGRPAVNLDCWAMRPALLRHLAGRQAAGADFLVIEGAMGLFDGGDGGAGSTAELAKALGLPVVLVVDASRQAQSAAALAQGFCGFDRDVEVAGVIVNRVAGARHGGLIADALAAAGIAVIGTMARTGELDLASRHLGLVQAGEAAGLERVIEAAAASASAGIDLARLGDAARALPGAQGGCAIPAPPGQRIALASDRAFAFAYHHVLESWRASGAEIIAFSPLGDEAPDAEADAVILPGGYPELHAGRLAGNQRLIAGLRRKAEAGALIYGECGGYMLLGRGLVDAGGERHAMAGLLALETSFAAPRLSLGYRRAVAGAGQSLAAPGTVFRAHEFHYATAIEENGEPLFAVTDMAGHALGAAGLARGRVSGSFLHVIDVE